jgi:hypothetical protein
MSESESSRISFGGEAMLLKSFWTHRGDFDKERNEDHQPDEKFKYQRSKPLAGLNSVLSLTDSRQA